MIDAEIEQYLKQKNLKFDDSIKDSIESKRLKAIDIQDEDAANYYWCMSQVFKIQRAFVTAFNYLQSGKFEDAWNLFDCADIDLGVLEENYMVDRDKDLFHLCFIGKMIKEYQKLFPYHHFFSREAIIKEEKCNICGKVVSIRHPCGHVPGKLYMGKLCLREITDLEFKAIAIVTDPFDKYSIVKIDGKDYDYGMLKYLLEIVHDPFEPFHIRNEMIKRDEYKGIGRNDLCPCGSGKKYKRCHMGKDSELMNHYIVCLEKRGLPNACSNMDGKIRTFTTWKE